MEAFGSILYLEGASSASRRALARALDVAWRHRAKLTIGHVIGGSRVEPGATQRAEGVLRRSQDRVAALVASGVHEVDADFRTFPAQNSTEFKKVVTDGGYDLVMTSVSERAPLRPWTTWRFERSLLQACPVPLWFVDAAQTNPVREVLVAVEVGRGHSPPLNRRLLEAAAAVASPTSAALHVVHAWNLAGSAVLTSPIAGVGRSHLRRMRARERRGRQQGVAELAGLVLPDVSTHLHVKEGDAAPVIRETARKVDADVVVVGNSLRRGISGLVFGNLAERLIGSVPSSVLVLPVKAVAPSPFGGRSARDGGVGHNGGLEVRS